MHNRKTGALLRQLANEKFPDSYDRWPAIQARVLERRAASVALPMHRRMAQRPRRTAFFASGAFGVILLAVALLAALAPWAESTQTASAEEILQQAGVVAAQQSEASGTPGLHLIATRQFDEQFGVPPWAFGSRLATIERWQADDGKFHESYTYLDANGAVVSTQRYINNGDDGWLVFEIGGETEAMHIAEIDLWDQSVSVEGDISDPSSLVADLITQVADISMEGCATTERQADRVVAGRPVYVVVVTSVSGQGGEKSSDGCGLLDGVGARLVLRADQETFLLLGWEQYSADGALVAGYNVTSIELDAPLSDDSFNYTPPADAFVCGDRASSYPLCETKLPRMLSTLPAPPAGDAGDASETETFERPATTP